MNFIYDILVNFSDDLYDFYEWNTDDNVTHIRKIPLFKVSTETLEKLKNYNVKVDLDFLKKLENKTEKFTSRDVEKITYCALFSDSNDVYALKFNEKGNNIKISKLLIDESEDVLDVIERCNEIKLDLEILKPKKINNFKTRLQLEKTKYLTKCLNRLEKNNDLEKLKYLYFECFNEKETSKDIIINKLKQGIDNAKLEKIMYDFFKLISIN